jgi:hypothetical protein
MARLSSSTNPCPDRLLADRVRYLTDLNVELLEVVSSRTSPADRSAGDTLRTTYRVKELIRGRSGTSWTDVPYQSVIPSPLDRDQYIPNPVLPFLKPGEKVLAFTGAKFQSCRLVPYTQSAEWAVRSATPAPKLREDEQDEGNQ